MFLDIAIGIYVAAFLGRMIGFGPDAWFFIGAILITVLPDSDFLYHFLKRKGDRDRINDHSHRDYIHYPFFYLYSQKENTSPKRILFSISKEQMGYYVREYGDKDWFKNIYLKWHPIAIVEYTVFISSIIFLLFYILC